MIELSIPWGLLMKSTPSLIKRFITCYGEGKAKLLIVPYEELKKLIIKYLCDNDFIVFDLDHPDAYIDHTDEDITRFTNNKVSMKRLVKKFKDYTMDEFKGEGSVILYVCSSLDYISLFKKKCVYAFLPSSIYLSMENIQKDELFDLKIKVASINKENKFIFSNKTDALIELDRHIRE